MEHLELPVLDARETKVTGREILEVERLDDGGFRLLHSPALVWGLAGGDVIDLDPAALSGFRLRSRAGNVAVLVGLKDAAEKESPAVRHLIEGVAALAGICEGGPGRALVFTIPVTAGFARIEKILKDFCDATGDATWGYGNVYGRDDLPLRWWQDS